MLTNKAVALKYEQESQSAPTIVAKGKGAIAQSIIEKAQEYDIAIFKNPELTNSLINLEVDTQIPPKLYDAVVEVFIWLMKKDKH